MNITTLFIGLFLLTLVSSISHYDFNACRINNCNSEEVNCIGDEQGCLTAFGEMRNCFTTCSGTSSFFNDCWQKCRNLSARSNLYWYSLSLCYQNICYLFDKLMVISIAALILLSLL